MAPEVEGIYAANRRQMRVDNAKALAVLELQSRLALEDPLPDDHDWVKHARRLTQLCETGPKTHIAMLGTALLAKATEPGVDVFALKTSAKTKGAYSARSLAKDVLAANAPRLQIDLGATGREPLNNQPYFRGNRINDDLEKVVRKDGRPAFDYVRKCLTELERLSQNEAALALRAFLQVRHRSTVLYKLPKGLSGIIEAGLSNAVARFVTEDSEGGKRAQAVAAGLLDVMYSAESVLVKRVNDPDRHFPGDVAVSKAGAEDGLTHTFEVRDKEVTESDLYHSVQKAAGSGVRRAAVVAIAPAQSTLDTAVVTRFAQRHGVKFAYFHSWSHLVSDVLFHSSNDPQGMLDGAVATILARLQDLEVSKAGIERWIELAASIERLTDTATDADQSLPTIQPHLPLT